MSDDAPQHASTESKPARRRKRGTARNKRGRKGRKTGRKHQPSEQLLSPIEESKILSRLLKSSEYTVPDQLVEQVVTREALTALGKRRDPITKALVCIEGITLQDKSRAASNVLAMKRQELKRLKSLAELLFAPGRQRGVSKRRSS